MPSAALGAKSVAMPARKSCVRTTRTRTMSRMTRTSPMKIRRSALIGTTIASFNRGTVLVLELDDEPDRARASGHAGTDLGPACASGDVGRARVQVRVVDQDDHAAARAAAAGGLRSPAGRARPAGDRDRAGTGDRLRREEDDIAAATAATAGVAGRGAAAATTARAAQDERAVGRPAGEGLVEGAKTALEGSWRSDPTRRAPAESAARAARAAVATLPGVGRSTRGPDGPDTTGSTGPAEAHRPRGAGTAAEFAGGGSTNLAEGPVDRRGARDEDPRVPRGERETGIYCERGAVDITRQRDVRRDRADAWSNAVAAVAVDGVSAAAAGRSLPCRRPGDHREYGAVRAVRDTAEQTGCAALDEACGAQAAERDRARRRQGGQAREVASDRAVAGDRHTSRTRDQAGHIEGRADRRRTEDRRGRRRLPEVHAVRRRAADVDCSSGVPVVDHERGRGHCRSGDRTTERRVTSHRERAREGGRPRHTEGARQGRREGHA